jgi:hypothetical protein
MSRYIKWIAIRYGLSLRFYYHGGRDTTPEFRNRLVAVSSELHLEEAERKIAGMII